MGVCDNSRLSSGTGGNMVSYDIVFWNADKLIRIVIAEVGFAHKRKLGDVLNTLNIIRTNTCFFHFSAVKRRVSI